MTDASAPPDPEHPLELGAFSISLSVSDLGASRAFYERLGFRVTGGDADQGWLILVNGTTVIGLFHGMFEGNILTFNPGMAQDYEPEGEGLPEPKPGFTDVREIEKRLTDAGIELMKGTETESGPDHVLVTDPDGNVLMFDQFY